MSRRLIEVVGRIHFCAVVEGRTRFPYWLSGGASVSSIRPPESPKPDNTFCGFNLLTLLSPAGERFLLLGAQVIMLDSSV